MFLRSLTVFFLLGLYIQAEEIIHFCVKKVDTNISMVCEEQCILKPSDTIATSIKQIQMQLRHIIDEVSKSKNIVTLVLYGKGFEGTLLAVAQTNLLPDYREYIKGIILDDSPSDIDSLCRFDLKVDNPLDICKDIKSFANTLGKKASLQEVSHALSPILQLDWYWPPVWVRSDEKDLQHKKWVESLRENASVYFESSLPEKSELIEKTSFNFLEAIRTKENSEKQGNLPNYYGPLLRFHLNKILYASIRQVTKSEDISYGSSEEQTYDMYEDKKTKQHSVMVYVHGGGWSKGDKHNFSDLCTQYANKGYTAIALNYRLLNLPKVGMKEMINDVKMGLEDILQKQAKDKPVIVMGESAGAQLLFMALAKMSNPKIKVAIFNSIVADLHKYPEEKQKRLSGIKAHKKRIRWLNAYSPLSNIQKYAIPTLALHSLDDKVVLASHLKALDVKSVIYHHNITPFWINNATHPLSPKNTMMQPGYRDMEREIGIFIYKHLK